MSASLREQLHRRLDRALDARRPLLKDPDTNVGRLLNGSGEGIPGLVLERLGPALIAQLHAGQLNTDEDILRDLCAHAAERVGATAVYRKLFPQDRSQANPKLLEQLRDPQPWLGTPLPAEFPVRENGLTFLVRAYDGYATGLFLDHRDHRARVRTWACGRRVLNTFSYTCGYTVSAACGESAATVSVDLSRKALAWGRRNLAANDITLDQHRFICSDIFDYYRRAERQRQCFDLIILDPPTFSRSGPGRRTLALSSDLGRLVAGALKLLSEPGMLLVCVNRRTTTTGQLEQALCHAAQETRHSEPRLRRWQLPADFRGDPGQAKSISANFGAAN